MGTLHLKGLNGLRAIAAFAVIIAHISRDLGWFNLPNGAATDLAGYGVTLFFALSGFLITYLLLKEKEKTSTISVKNFYIRRILRIWPLYYFYFAITLLVAYLCNEQQLSARDIAFSIFLLPNVPYLLNSAVAISSHYWSLGVEEQFYSFWAIALKKSKSILTFLLLFIGCFLLLKFAFRWLEYKGGSSLPYLLFTINRFDCMAIGGLGAYYFYNQHWLLRYASHWSSQLMAWGILALCAINRFHFASIIDHEIFAVVTVILIINVSSPAQSILNLEHKIFDFLGRISFGLYVYHPLVIFILGKLLFSVQLPIPLKITVAFSTSIATTVGIAYLSYELFEKRFIKLKQKFSTVLSENSSFFKD